MVFAIDVTAVASVIDIPTTGAFFGIKASHTKFSSISSKIRPGSGSMSALIRKRGFYNYLEIVDKLLSKTDHTDDFFNT